MAGSPRFGSVGRQPVIDYLTKDYVGFRQGMLNRIPELLPNWTDRSEADFGVVLIELFAYVADILSYYQDRVANESFLVTATERRSVAELLRLIGYQIDPGLSASALIHFEVSDASDTIDITAASLPIRVKTSGVAAQSDVTFEITRAFTLRSKNNAISLESVDALEPSATAIRLPQGSHALSPEDVVYLEEIPGRESRGGAARRSPAMTITSIEAAEDGTDTITWSPPLPERFDPARSKLKGNNIIATHGETVTEEITTLTRTDAPATSFVLSRRPVSHLLRTRGTQRRRSKPELEVRVSGVLWDEVDSFVASGPGDRHYVTSIDVNDEVTVTFGTGTRGVAVPDGLEIRVQYRIGIGSVGNVGAGTLTRLEPSIPGVTAVTNPLPAEGGVDRESTEEAKISGPGSIIAQQRAVTLEDYALLAQEFPGIAKARARVGLRGGYKVVRVFVSPEHHLAGVPPPVPAERKLALKRHLEARMPVNRMAGVDVLDAFYVPVDMTAEVHLRPETQRREAFDRAHRALTELLALSRRSFGEPVRVGEIFTALFPLDGVAFVQLKRLARRGTPAPASECALADVPIDDHELAVEGDVDVIVVGGQ
jgi:hypothetical protein